MKPGRTKGTAKKARKRSDEDWAPRFLANLARRGNILRACEASKVGRTTYYKRRDGDSEFHAQVIEAFKVATDRLEDEARRRAEDGLSRPVLFKGKIVYVWTDAAGNYVGPKTKGASRRPLLEHEYSDTLLIFLLKAHRPRKFRERHHVEHTGKGGKAIKHEHEVNHVTPPADVAARRALLLAGMGKPTGTNGSRVGLGKLAGDGPAA